MNDCYTPSKNSIDKQSEGRVPIPALVVILLTAYFLMDLGLAEIVKFIGEYAFNFPVDEPPALLNFILIPVGAGLLRRQSSQRGCALWVMGILVIGMIGVLSMLFYTNRTADSPEAYNTGDLVTAILFILGSAISWCAIKKYKGYFSSNLSDPIQRNSTVLIWLFMLISIFANSMSMIAYKNYAEELEGVFYLETEIYAYDSETKKPISISSMGWSNSFENSDRNKVFTSYRSKVLGGNEIDFAVLSGIVFGEYTFGIQGRGSQNEGYIEKTVVINKDSLKEIMVYLEPTRKGKGKGKGKTE